MKSSILKRDIFDKIQPFLGTKNIIVLHGARQVGKTHILYYIQNYLQEKKKSHYYIDLEDSRYVELLDRGIEAFLNYLKGEGWDGKKTFVFIDEIQRKIDTGLFLKGLYDRNLPYKFIVTGSGSVELKEKVHESLRKLYKNIGDDDLVPESEIISSFLEHVKDVSEQYKDEEIVKRWLSISKNIGKNPLGEWGKTSSPNIRAKGVRDYAFLVIRRHGSPIHFREVAKSIEKLFGRKAHVATTHNELIKDPRFILVGRGLYALSEWGYMSGVVRDVIRKVLEKSGPLTKEEIVNKVLKERYVKENTILVNLQNLKFFKKDKDGRYSLVQ